MSTSTRSLCARQRRNFDRGPIRRRLTIALYERHQLRNGKGDPMCRERRDLDAGPFGVGATMMIAVSAVQARLTCAGPEAPTLMGATNLASLNVAKLLVRR